MEEHLKRLCERYGDDFPWVALSHEDSDTLVRELEKELSPDHELYYAPIRHALARRADRDDVLYASDDGVWYLVHLTWKKETSPEWPRYDEFPTLQEAVDEIEQRFLYA